MHFSIAYAFLEGLPVAREVLLVLATALFVVALLTHALVVFRAFRWQEPDEAQPEARRPLASASAVEGAPVHLHVVVIEAGAPAAGCTLAQLVLWRRHEVSIFGIWRRDVYHVDPPLTFRLAPGDRVVLVGRPAGLLAGAHLFRTFA